MVRTLRAELGTAHRTVQRVARQLGYRVESVRSSVPTGKRRFASAFVGTFPPTQCGLAMFTESMVRSISQHLLTATVSWKAQGTDHSAARGMCRATDCAGSGRERS